MEQKPSANAKGNWRIHAVIATWCVAAVSTEHWFPGWSGAIGVGGAVPALVVYSTSKAWGEVWYWITIAALTVLQIPLMMHVQPFIVRLKFAFLFPFAFVDYFAVAIIMQCLAWFFSKAYARNHTSRSTRK
jgi:hypothetical protein